MQISAVILDPPRSLERAVEEVLALPISELIVVEPSSRLLKSSTRQWLANRGVVICTSSSVAGADRNAAVRAARGDWLMFMDLDDLPDPAYFERAVAAGEAAHAGFVTAWSRTTVSIPSVPRVIDLAAALGRPDLIHPSTLFRRRVWEAIDGFDEGLPGGELYDFWLRLLQCNHAAAFVDAPMFGAAAVARDRPIPEVVIQKHRGAFTDHLAQSLVDRDRAIEGLRGVESGLHAMRKEARGQLDDLTQEIASVTAQLRGVGLDRVAWGDLRNVAPISDVWGADRGRRIDRYYIEAFLESHRHDIRGRVLEVHDSDDTVRFGGDHVSHSDVLDIDAANPRATIVADQRNAAAIPSSTYDCLILTQTLHVIDDLHAAVRESARLLKPGGVALVTLPCVSRIAPEQGLDADFWRFTAAAARRLFEQHFDAEHVTVRSHGNVLVSLAFLYGLASHELRPGELDAHDPYFPLLVTVRARK